MQGIEKDNVKICKKSEVWERMGKKYRKMSESKKIKCHKKKRIKTVIEKNMGK